jgi:hypothetical protein
VGPKTRGGTEVKPRGKNPENREGRTLETENEWKTKRTGKKQNPN